MQKLFYTMICLGLIAFGCRSTRTAQHSVKADTVLSQSPAKTLKPVDSNAILKAQLTIALNAPVNYTTFYGKAKANLSSSQFSGSATVYIKMQKDSVIWISVTGPLNIEGERILITPDSIKMMNRLEGKVQISSIANLQKLTKLPLNFNDLQNIILGNPILDSNSEPDYMFKKDSITVTSSNEVLKYIYSFGKNNLQLVQSNFQTLNNSSVTGGNIFYRDYQETAGINFSANRDIAVTGKSPATVQLNFKEFNFNQPQTFLFTISKNYSIEYE